MGITLEQYRCSIGTSKDYTIKRNSFIKRDNNNKNYKNIVYPFNQLIIFYNTLFIVYCFAILYIFIFIETLLLDFTLISSSATKPRYYLNFHTSHHNLILTARYLTYINIPYITILKVDILRVGKVSTVIYSLRNGTKSFVNFILTSLSLYLTVINITLIIISNCSLLNPGPKDPNSISVFYQNI